jgi:hypothetical protein
MSESRSSFDHHYIAQLAYTYWEQRGRPTGSPEVDWHRAVAALSTFSDVDVPVSAFALGPDTGGRR